MESLARPGGASVGPLTPEHVAQISAARDATRRIRRTAGLARVSAWTTGILGALTLLGVIFGDVASLFLGCGLIALGVREGRLASRLGRFDPGAPRLLAINQLTFGAGIVAYALWQAWSAFRSSGLSAGSQPIGDAQVDAMLADVGAMVRSISIAFYVCVAFAGVLGTGLMALYYWRCTPTLRRFLASTPEWVVQTMRAAA